MRKYLDASRAEQDAIYPDIKFVFVVSDAMKLRAPRALSGVRNSCSAAVSAL